MNIRLKHLLAIWTIVLFCVGSLSATPAKTPTTFHVGGAVAKSSDWNVEKIERDFSKEIKTLDYSIKGTAYSSRCVPLLSLIQAAQPRYSSKSKHPELRFLVKVAGQDGYSIWFSMGELAPDFGNREVYVALDVDGKPFENEQAPVRLLVPGESDYGRWIYGIKTISIVDGSKVK